MTKAQLIAILADSNPHLTHADVTVATRHLLALVSDSLALVSESKFEASETSCCTTVDLA